MDESNYSLELSLEDRKEVEEILHSQMLSEFDRLKNYLLSRNISINLINNLDTEGNYLMIDITSLEKDRDFIDNLLSKLFEEYGFVIIKKENNKYLIRYVGKNIAEKLNKYQISLEEYYKLKDTQILNYDRYKERINRILNNRNAKNKINKCKNIATTRYGYEVEHYSVGTGNKHLIVIGGTNGDEIITVDYVLSLMEEIANGNLSDIDLDYFTIDFFPLHNPEGFIISTSILDYYFHSDMTISELQDKCILYKMSYNIDNNDSKSTSRYYLFDKASWQLIPSKHHKLREAVRKICEYNHYQPQSIIEWKSNGSGVKLTFNSPENPDFERILNGEVLFGDGINSKVVKSMPGPIGVPSINPSKFVFEIENISLFNYIARLYQSGCYAGVISYQASNNKIYINKQIHGDFPCELNSSLNSLYELGESGSIDYGTSAIGSIYPSVFLINLPIDNGQFIAPYSDILGSYKKCIDNSHIQFVKNTNLVKALTNILNHEYQQDIKKIK